MATERFLEPIAVAIGVSHTELSYAFSMLFCFVNGFIFRTLFGVDKVTSTTRHYVSIVSGVVVLLFCFGSETIHLIILTGVGLMLVCFISRKHVHKYVFAYALLHNFTVHLLQMFYGKDAAIDITAPMMFATIRMSYIGFAYHEGVSKNDTAKENGHLNNNNIQKIEKREFPTTLEVISYMFFFGSILVGPPSNFKSYKKFIDGTDINADSSKDCAPSPLKAAMWKFCLSVVLLCGFLWFESINISPQLLADSIFLTTVPFWKKILYGDLVLYWLKFKYYSVFYVGEACVNMAGFGFNGYDEHGNALWDGLINVKPIAYEKSQFFGDLTTNWNIQTAVWLKSCVYERVKTSPILATLFVSSVWHGVLFGYYTFFLSIGVVLYPQKAIWKKLSPVVHKSNTCEWIYWICSFLVNRILMQYFNAAFIMRDMYATLRYWRSMFFYGHVVIVFGIVAAKLLPDYRKIYGNTEKKSQ